MSLKLQIRFLYACAAILALAGIVLVAERYIRVSANSPSSSKQRLPRQSQNSQPTDQLPKVVPIDWFEPLWDKRLQGKPVEPEPVIPKQQVAREKPKVIEPKVSKRPPPLEVQGILYSPSFSVASLSYQGGKSQSAKTGDMLEDIRIMQIGLDKITVEYLGQEFVLGLEQ